VQAIVLAQADAAARVARLRDGHQLHQSDWEAMALHALLCGPAERLGQRLASRLECLPWSHHHRFLVYEQVRMAAAASPWSVPAAKCTKYCNT
jgi:hypothetical protein